MIDTAAAVRAAHVDASLRRIARTNLAHLSGPALDRAKARRRVDLEAQYDRDLAAKQCATHRAILRDAGLSRAEIAAAGYGRLGDR